LKALNPLHSLLSDASLRAGQAVSRHPRAVGSTLAASLLGFAATAFGLAPLTAPVTDQIPRSRTVIEELSSVDIGNTRSQLDQIAEHDLQMLRNDTTRSGDTADSLLNRLNVIDGEATTFLRSDMIARKVLAGSGGKMVQVRTNSAGSLQELIARYPTDNPSQVNSHFNRLRIIRDPFGFSTELQTVPLVAQTKLGTALVQHSLFSATDQANIPDAVARQVAEIFANDFDFRQVPRGARVSVVYETLTADDEPITWRQMGRIVAAQFAHGGRDYSAVWFKDGSGKGGYFDLQGQSKRRSFLSSPLAASRVTSGFAVRFHPLRRTWAQHKGIDYAAPTGTPVRSVANGYVDFAGWQNGYGNVISLDHGNGRNTLYAHLSRIDVQMGQRVSQGATIGAVGTTGWSTGPHLHFELKVNGVHQNPQNIASSSNTEMLDPSTRFQFDQVVKSAKTKLSLAQTVAIARSLD
jgi:murein DD-endopeptidase MepM/ murein hydrolase activator NlpD